MVHELEVLVDGRGLVDAPRWQDGRLYFSDWTTGEVLAADAAGGGQVATARVTVPGAGWP